ncbi:shikimate kinase [Candidatus Parcubacteria bacterium]|nr:MAG: shikimate kinase [Candidatus Parcubacteria bacterium]
MNLIFIYGLPGVGKLTVAKELSKLTNYQIFHNHLTVNLVGSIFSFGSEPFTKLREEIWLRVFDYACTYQINGLIFTFVFEKTVSDTFIENAKKVVGERGKVYFVELICDGEQLLERIKDESRKSYNKISDVTKFNKLIKDGLIFNYSINSALKINNTCLSPEETARKITEQYHF